MPKLSILNRLSQFIQPASNEGSDFDTLPYDGVSWRFAEYPAKILAVGDLHGDLTALATLLLEAELIDSSGNWVGLSSHVVLL